MPVVKMPDGALVEMPDNPTPDQLAALESIAREDSKRGLLHTGKEGVMGLARGAVKAGLGAAESIFASGVLDPKTEKPVRHPFFPMVEEKLKSFLEPEPAATVSDAYVRSVSQGVGGALMSPAGAAGQVRNVVAGASAGGAGELAERLFPGQGWARPVGELIGGLGSSLVMAPRTNAPELAREVTEKVKPTHLDIAQQRMIEARANGLPINASQGMPMSSNIDDMVESLANSRYGDQTVDLLRQQPGVLRIRSGMELGKLPGEAVSPQVIANRMQEAATGEIRDAQRRANTAFRQKLPAGTMVKPESIAAFEKRLDAYIEANPNTQAAAMAAEVKKALRLAPEGAPEAVPLGAGKVAGRIVQKVEPPPVEYILDAGKLKNAIDDRISAYGQSQLNDPRNARFIDRAANNIRTLFDRTVAEPGTPLREARKAAREVYVNEVNPLKKSVVGRLAGPAGSTEDREAATAKLLSIFSRGTPDAKNSEILAIERMVRKQDPDLFADAVKSHITDKLKSVGPTVDARDVDNFAAQVKKALMPTPAHEQGLRDMLAGAARSKGLPEKEVVDGFMNFMKLSTLAAQRPPKISGLPIPDLKEVAGSSARETVLHGPFGTLAAVGKKIRMALSEDAYRTMDKLLNSPEGIDTLRELAKTPVMSKKAAAVLSTFYAAEGAPDSGGIVSEQ